MGGKRSQRAVARASKRTRGRSLPAFLPYERGIAFYSARGSVYNTRSRIAAGSTVRVHFLTAGFFKSAIVIVDQEYRGLLQGCVVC